MPPDAIARIARLELRAKAVVEGVLVGLHKSPSKGHSVEFLQHREYVPGDDPRRVDWKVWGRQDRLYVKEFEEETNLRLTLAVDCSASMDYVGTKARSPRERSARADAGGGGPQQPPSQGRASKYECAATIAATLAWLALSHGDAAGVATFDDRIRVSVPPRTARSHLASIIDVLEYPRGRSAPAPEATAFRPVMRRLAETLPRRGLVIVISDLLGDAAGLMPGLKQLRTRGHDVALLHVLDDDELDFPFDSPTRFDAMETGDFVTCNPRAFRTGYLEALGDFLAGVRQQAAALECDYELVRTGEPMATALVRFLSRRARMAV